MPLITRFFFVILVLCWSPVVKAAPNFLTVDVPEATCTSAGKINNRDQIVGWYCDGTAIRSFLWHKNKFTTLTAIPGSINAAAGINNLGDIVGSYIDESGIAHGFLLDDRGLTTIDFPGAAETSATDIADNGWIVGTYADRGGKLHGFLLANGQFTSIDIPGANYTQAFGINDSGQVVGFYVDAQLLGHGYIWEEGMITTLDHPEATFNTAVYDVNSRDDVVGFHDAQGGSSFVRQARLRTLSFPPSIHDPRVTGINDKGQMVGEYFDDSGNLHGFFWRRAAYKREGPISDQRNVVEQRSVDNSAALVGTTQAMPILRPWFLDIP